MKIAIDCRMINMSGIGTYLSGSLPFLLNNKDNSYILLGDIKKLEKYKNFNVEIKHTNIPIFSSREFFIFPVKEINECDIFYTPNYNIPSGIKIPIYSTIHDVVFLDVNGLVSKLGKLIRKYFLNRAIKISKKIFTVSEFSKSRIKYYFGDKKEIIVTYNGLSEFIVKHEECKNIINSKNIIYLGNIKKHKGLNILLEAYIKAKKRGFSHNLVIIGNQDNFKTKDKSVIDLINRMNKNKEIIFTGRIESNELIEWIKDSEALIQPSIYEGFGIPPLEAMALGTQAIVSDIEVFREVYAKLPVTFFKAEDSDDLAQKLLEINSNNLDIKKKIIEMYSYETVANKIINEIEEV